MQTFSTQELKFSEKAILHFASSLKNNGKSDGVRIGVRKAGCSGFEYFFEFVETSLADTNDFIFDISIDGSKHSFVLSSKMK